MCLLFYKECPGCVGYCFNPLLKKELCPCKTKNIYTKIGQSLPLTAKDYEAHPHKLEFGKDLYDSGEFKIHTHIKSWVKDPVGQPQFVTLSETLFDKPLYAAIEDSDQATRDENVTDNKFLPYCTSTSDCFCVRYGDYNAESDNSIDPPSNISATTGGKRKRGHPKKVTFDDTTGSGPATAASRVKKPKLNNDFVSAEFGAADVENDIQPDNTINSPPSITGKRKRGRPKKVTSADTTDSRGHAIATFGAKKRKLNNDSSGAQAAALSLPSPADAATEESDSCIHAVGHGSSSTSISLQ
ncbi:hypothetical protein B0H66DRAFT_602229 [Apodospora peruviana]|uniref:Uncharacterized protein n=1 Tax=Apodospora peruviana TaxID=516989 RepID=A0AAE0M7X4_9PEZI|nr:hypothetical protein B0H66DRAFT_602229 [Apodospora peruviana]